MADLNEPKKETVRITPPSRNPNLPAVPPEKETVRINLPNRPPPGARNLSGSNSSPAPVRPSAPPSAVAPKPVPPPGGSPVKRPPTPPMARSLVPVRPPPASTAPKTAPLSTAPDEIPGTEPATTPTGAQPPLSPAAPPISSIPSSPPLGGTLGASPIAPAGPRKETARIGATPDAPMKSTVKLTPIQPHPLGPAAGGIRTRPPAEVANPLSPGLVESAPTQLCWALVGISALILLIQLWTYFS